MKVLPPLLPTGAVAPIALPDGGTLPVEIRRSARARRVALRVLAGRGVAELVVPQRASLAGALAFLESRRGWLVARALRIPARVPFVDGAVIPLLGQPHRLVAVGPGGRRGSFIVADGRIEVTGRPEHLARRTEDGLRGQASRLLTAKTWLVAARLGHPPPVVTIGDPRARWGSCSAAGRIRYSWRLVLAPMAVLDYVAAHECAHLIEANHSAKFWAVVHAINGDHRPHRDWLKANGARLHAFGRG